MRAADGALRIFAQLQFAEAHGESVEEQETADKRVTFSDDQFKGFRGLNRADDSWKHAENSAFGARGHQAGRGRFGIEAAVARAAGRSEDANLSFKAENRAVHVRLAEKDAGVVYKIAGGEIIGAVNDDVVVLHYVERVVAGQMRFEAIDLDFGVQALQAIGGGFDFWAADVGGAEKNLALEIGEVDGIEIDKANAAYSCGGQIETERRAKASGSNAEYFCLLQLELTFHADFGHDEVTAVTQDFFFGERRSEFFCRRGWCGV